MVSTPREARDLLRPGIHECCVEWNKVHPDHKVDFDLVAGNYLTLTILDKPRAYYTTEIDWQALDMRNHDNLRKIFHDAFEAWLAKVSCE